MRLTARAPVPLRARNPLPEGTVSVGLGLLVSGVCLYGVLTIASRALGPQRYAPFAAFWPLLFVCGPGFFLPLEQEVGRALADRRARSLGGRPLVRRAAAAGGSFALVLIAAALIAQGPLVDRLFDGSALLLMALVVGLAAYFGEHLARGTLSGNSRFHRYGLLMGSEGVLRVAGCLVLAALGIREPGAYGMVMVLGSLGSIAIALYGQRGLLKPGPEAPWSELSSALGFLLIGSFLTQLLFNVGPLAVKVLASPGEAVATGSFLNGVILTRIPLFLFQAVQAALLPKLAGLLGAGRFGDFRRALARILIFVAGIALLATPAAYLIGPFAIRLLFGPDFDLGHADLGYLAAASGGFMIALCLTQALISLDGYVRAALGWTAGCAAFVAITALGSDLLGRVERGLLGGAIAAVGLMAVLLVPLVSRHAPAAEALGAPPGLGRR
ncbi:MAG TPA: hypothetical protein VE219_04600 [Candidatus Sulfotelmatobacter sp.]|nr:hypothetical protein [Candidatus Sulfotelmatobacter sp.]